MGGGLNDELLDAIVVLLLTLVVVVLPLTLAIVVLLGEMLLARKGESIRGRESSAGEDEIFGFSDCSG
jgi:hypothetical protein